MDGSMTEKGGALDVLLIGDVMMDYQYWVAAMPKPGGDVEILSAAQNSGGSAANTAVALCAQGFSCTFCGRVGNDETGAAITRRMRRMGLDLSCLQYGGESGYTVTIIDADGERTMFSYRGAKDYRPGLTPSLRTAVSSCRVMFISGYMLLEEAQARFVIQVMELARRGDCHIMLDAAPVIGSVNPEILRQVLALTDIVLPNRTELEALTGTCGVVAGLEALLERVPCVALKLGAEGSILAAVPGFRLPGGEVLRDGVRCAAKAIKISAVDSTGAGDSFNAGFAGAFLRGETPEQWLKAGNKLAAVTITRRGAVSNYNE